MARHYYTKEKHFARVMERYSGDTSRLPESEIRTSVPEYVVQQVSDKLRNKTVTAASIRKALMDIQYHEYIDDVPKILRALDREKYDKLYPLFSKEDMERLMEEYVATQDQYPDSMLLQDVLFRLAKKLDLDAQKN